jgi:hypothetical protein
MNPLNLVQLIRKLSASIFVTTIICLIFIDLEGYNWIKEVLTKTLFLSFALYLLSLRYSAAGVLGWLSRLIFEGLEFVINALKLISIRKKTSSEGGALKGDNVMTDVYSNNLLKIYTTVECFSPAEYPELDQLSEEIRSAKSLYEMGRKSEISYAEVEKFLSATFLPINIPSISETISDDEFAEFQAGKVKLVRIDDFSESLPSCSLEAWIDVPLPKQVSARMVTEILEEAGELLADGIMFSWNFEDEELEDYDLTMESHAGLEAIADQ